MNSKISVIIPVYNGEKYLPACMRSIQNQTYENLEIILIDDGSSDTSPALCDGYAREDERVRVIHQANSGVSAARNNGLAEATGDYISFIDADDYIREDYFQRLFDELIRYKVDIVCCDFDEITDGCSIHSISVPKVLKERILSDAGDPFRDMAEGKETYWSCVWGKLIKREVALKATFPENLKYGEDQIYMYQLFLKTFSVFLSPYKGYFYVRNTNSATLKRNEYNIARCFDEMKMQEMKLKLLPDFSGDITSFFVEQYAFGIHGYARAVSVSGTREERARHRKIILKLIRELVKNPLLSSRARRNLDIYRYLPFVYRFIVKRKAK